MGTTSFIGKVEKNGSITGIHCHWGGDINENGKLLHDYYFERNRVNKLIGLGRLSSLGPTIGEKINMDNEKQYAAALDNQCIAYHRDRNEDLEIHKREKIDNLIRYYECVYIYGQDNLWYVYRSRKPKLLSDALAEISKQPDEKNETDEANRTHYLFILSGNTPDSNDVYTCRTPDFNTALCRLYMFMGGKSALFEKALTGMTTDKEKIELFNQFSNTDIQRTYAIEKEIGTDEECANDADKKE